MIGSIFTDTNTNKQSVRVSSTTVSLWTNLLQRLTITTDGLTGLLTTTPETTLDVNGATTLRDWVYLNNGTHTGDAVGDRRYKVVSDVFTLQRCTVVSATKGDATAGNWLTYESTQLKSLTDSNELIGSGSFIDLETSRSGRGSITFGDGVGYADFIFTSAGVVTLIQYTSNVFTAVQTGINHVIIKDNGTGVRIVNEMGSTINFNVKIQYN